MQFVQKKHSIMLQTEDSCTPSLSHSPFPLEKELFSRICYFYHFHDNFKTTTIYLGFPGGSVARNLPANAGDEGSNHGSGRVPGEGNGNPL